MARACITSPAGSLRTRRATGSDLVNPSTGDLVNPSTGEIFATAPVSGPAGVDAAFDAASAAFEG